MAPSKKEESRGSAPPKINESRISAGRSGIRGTVAAAGAAGVLVGAVGAFVWKWWSTTENHHQSCSGPSKIYNTGNCAICLTEMEQLKVLSCGHQYHHACIERMKKSGAPQNCPTCRQHFG